MSLELFLFFGSTGTVGLPVRDSLDKLSMRYETEGREPFQIVRKSDRQTVLTILAEGTYTRAKRSSLSIPAKFAWKERSKAFYLSQEDSI